MRFVVEDVGRPLTRFKNTKEVVSACRDAMIGMLLLLTCDVHLNEISPCLQDIKKLGRKAASFIVMFP